MVVKDSIVMLIKKRTTKKETFSLTKRVNNLKPHKIPHKPVPNYIRHSNKIINIDQRSLVCLVASCSSISERRA